VFLFFVLNWAQKSPIGFWIWFVIDQMNLEIIYEIKIPHSMYLLVVCYPSGILQVQILTTSEGTTCLYKQNESLSFWGMLLWKMPLPTEEIETNILPLLPTKNITFRNIGLERDMLIRHMHAPRGTWWATIWEPRGKAFGILAEQIDRPKPDKIFHRIGFNESFELTLAIWELTVMA